MNPIILQAIKNLTQKQGNDVVFVVGEPPGPERYRFCAANVDIWENSFQREYYYLLGEDASMNYGVEHLQEWQAEGYTVYLFVDPAHSTFDEFHNGTFDPFEDKEHWLYWEDYTPGTLLNWILEHDPERIEQAHEGSGEVK